MFKIILAFAAITAVVVAEPAVPEAVNRFLAVSRTSTSIVLSTTTSSTTVAKTCYTTAAALTACRRRRAAEEQPKIAFDGEEVEVSAIQPTQTQTVVVTTTPTIHDETEIMSSADDEVTALDNSLARAAFGITIYYTTTSTISITSYSTVTSGSKSFTLLGCLPANFQYSSC